MADEPDNQLPDEQGPEGGRGKREQAADALKDLAEGLEAAEEAAAEKVWEQAEADAPESREVVPSAGALEDEPDPAGSTAQLAEAIAPLAEKPVRTARAVARPTSAASDQYKRFMIPLLLVVGLALVALSVYALVAMSSQGGPTVDEFGVRSERGSLQQHGKLIVAIALPLGAVLLAASGWFFFSVRRSSGRGAR